MPRPETVDDIDLENIEVATFQVTNMGTNADLLLGYAAFLKAMEKAKAVVTSSYSGVQVTREPDAKERADQLKSKQDSWDEQKRQYDIYASVGSCEYSYMESLAKRYAETEGLPWPPVAEPIDSVDVTIANIEEVLK